MVSSRLVWQFARLRPDEVKAMSEFVTEMSTLVKSQKGQRTALSVEALAQSFLDNLFFVQGRSRERATVNDLYMALAHTVRDRLVERWISTIKNYQVQDV